MSLFSYNTKFQIAATLFLIVIIFSYFRMNKLSLQSTRWFNALLTMCAINMVFDIMTVYTITHMDQVPAYINDLCHRLFILTLVLQIVCFYFYITALGYQQRRFTLKETLWRLIPFFVAILMICFGKIKYHVSDDGVFSYGTTPSVVYSSIAVYMILIFYNTVKFKATLRREHIISIRIGIMLWVVAALIQLVFPKLLISGLASVLMMFFLYLSFQNPKELIDNVSGAFTERAFNYAITENLASGKKFYIIGILMNDFLELNTLFGPKYNTQLLSDITSELNRDLSLKVFLTGNTYKIIFKAKHGYSENLAIIQRCFNSERLVNGMSILVKSSIYVLECPTFAGSPGSISDIDHYLIKSYLPDVHDKQVTIVDESIITNHRRISIIQNLVSEALKHDGLDVFYQPIYDVQNKTFASAEALVRLKDTTTVGFVSPEEFIPLIEKNGLVSELGEVVFRLVCRFAKENKLSHMGVHYIEVNLSGVQAVDEKLYGQIKGILDEYDVPSEFINLEITETAAVEYKEILEQNMNNLRNLGCSFSMDDFGTGYSNISQIAQVQYDLIKLDKSLIWPCFGNDNPAKARIILNNIVNLIKQLDVKIVAEGVETAEQVEYLSSIGVDYLQGYHFSRPVKGEAYIEFLNKHQQSS